MYSNTVVCVYKSNYSAIKTILDFIIYMNGKARLQRTWIRLQINYENAEIAFKRPSNSFACQK